MSSKYTDNEIAMLNRMYIFEFNSSSTHFVIVHFH